MNNMNNENRIITALATPYGRSAVAVIRVSGKGCIELVEKLTERKLEIGKIKVNKFFGDNFKENLMTAAFKAPKSYSGEDTVELYPHGNTTICDGIIRTLLSNGASLAERGEFTKRAFLNGKIDLMQSEALADIIDAQTIEQLNYGNKRFDGGFKSLSEAESYLSNALSVIEALLHYGDELEGNERDGKLEEEVKNDIKNVIKSLESEISGYNGGKIINDGFKVALLGAPNVGKSTLLNALTQSERAIVTSIAGTTRDTVDGTYVYEGKKFVITDTAGLNDKTDDPVEKIGIERSLKAAADADAILYLTEKEKNYKIPKTLENSKVKIITVKNKCDDETDIGKEYKKAENGNILEISAEKKINITALKQKLYDICPKEVGSISNHRQYECVKKCLNSVNSAEKEFQKAESLEIVAALLYEAYGAIAELHGEKADEKIISAVFERFCVGK